jgi:hypothetical protein
MPASEQLPTFARFYLHSAVKGDPNPEGGSDPVYHDVIMAEVFVKGDRNTSMSKRVFKDDGETAVEYYTADKKAFILTEKYPIAWKAYQEGSDDYAEGTPLKALPKLGVSAIRNLHTSGIMCVEDLAQLADSVCIGESGMTTLRAQAKSFLEFMEPEKRAAEKKARDDEMQGLKDQIAELKALMTPKPRGRPKKAANLEA